MYGTELIIDFEGCNRTTFNYLNIRAYMIELCDKLGVERVAFTYEESEPGDSTEGNPKTCGITAVQVLVASSITLHALRLTGEMFIDIFTCGELDREEALRISHEFFKPKTHNLRVLVRGGLISRTNRTQEPRAESDLRCGQQLIDAFIDARILKREDQITRVEINAQYSGEPVTMKVYRLVDSHIIEKLLHFVEPLELRS